MKKIYLAVLLLSLCFSFSRAADVCASESCAVKEARTYKEKVENKNKNKKEILSGGESKDDKQLRELAQKYTKASAAQKPKVETEIRKELTAREDARIKLAKRDIARLEARLKAMKERAAVLEQNKPANVAANVEKVKQGAVEEVVSSGKQNKALVAPFENKEKKKPSPKKAG